MFYRPKSVLFGEGQFPPTCFLTPTLLWPSLPKDSLIPPFQICPSTVSQRFSKAAVSCLVLGIRTCMYVVGGITHNRDSFDGSYSLLIPLISSRHPSPKPSAIFAWNPRCLSKERPLMRYLASTVVCTPRKCQG
jgi:hypothetical protein